MPDDHNVQESLWEGMNFTQLLLHVWPYTPASQNCVQCGKPQVASRELCSACYQAWQHQSAGRPLPKNNTSGYVGVNWDKQNGKWRARVKRNTKIIWQALFDDLGEAARARAAYLAEHPGRHTPVTPGRARYGHDREMQGILMADRVGVSTHALQTWRKGGVPRKSVLEKIAPQLEAEFGVPADTWLRARELSHRPKRSRYQDEIVDGLQFNFWQVVGDAVKSDYGTRFVSVRCLLCSDEYLMPLSVLQRRISIACKSCRAIMLSTPNARSGYKGVQPHSSGKGWNMDVVLHGERTRRYFGPVRYGPHATEAAARAYDRLTRETHTTLIVPYLNFPDEYDQ